ncbi:unnamed protein product [Prorocentrum cordatum]|uniref:Uncharacterized protein n=1 Tax=Prorocentrum cordatum TaxID=2364126 RepID=A0ABN9UXJ6_9DINO|nr:unnamed protein product [Polarella glacialis]
MKAALRAARTARKEDRIVAYLDSRAFWAAALERRVSWGDVLNYVGQVAAAANDSAVPQHVAEQAAAFQSSWALVEAYSSSTRGDDDQEGQGNASIVLGELDWSRLTRCQAEVKQTGAAAAASQDSLVFPCQRFLFGQCPKQEAGRRAVPAAAVLGPTQLARSTAGASPARGGPEDRPKGHFRTPLARGRDGQKGASVEGRAQRTAGTQADLLELVPGAPGAAVPGDGEAFTVARGWVADPAVAVHPRGAVATVPSRGPSPAQHLQAFLQVHFGTGINEAGSPATRIGKLVFASRGLQGKTCAHARHRAAVSHGPIHRKQRGDQCTVFSFCTCGVDQGIRLHTWLPVWDELFRNEGRPLGGCIPASWTAEFRCHLRALGVASPGAWFGHGVWRGAAADVFVASGVKAMLARGGWRSVASAGPYVSGDEVAAGLLAQGVVDESGRSSVVVRLLSGREVAVVEVGPADQVRLLRQAVAAERPFGAGGQDGARVCFDLVLGERLLLDEETIEGSGLAGGGELLAVRCEPFCVLATAGREAVLLDGVTGATVRTFRGHRNAVRAAAVSASGDHILTASDDFTAKLFDSRTGACKQTLVGHRNNVNDAAFSTFYHDQIWDAATLHCEGTFRAPPGDTAGGAVLCVRCSPDGESVLTASEDCRAHLYKPGGAVLTASEDGEARLFEAASGACLRVLGGHGDFVVSAAFSEDGSKVLTASEDGKVRMFSLASGARVRTYELGRPVTSASIVAQGASELVRAGWPGAAPGPPSARRPAAC